MIRLICDRKKRIYFLWCKNIAANWKQCLNRCYINAIGNILDNCTVTIVNNFLEELSLMDFPLGRKSK